MVMLGDRGDDLMERLADQLEGLAIGSGDVGVPLVFATPGEMAKHVDPRTIQTTALDILDEALKDAANGKRPRLIFTMPPQEGKLIDDDEVVPTPYGWIRHGDLKAGDLVFHPSGRSIRVTEVHAPGEASMRVETTDGASIVVHPAHEWTVWDRSRGEWRTLETREIASRALKSGGRYTLGLPARGALQCPRSDLPMDPYALGVWLGDGSTSKGAITHHADDQYELPYEVSSRQIHPTTGVVTTYYAGLWADLRRAGVAGDKHIPDSYLWADEQSRWDLLCGLIDTDGSIDERGQLLFANVNERLAQQVAHLIRSFGYRAGERFVEPRVSTSGIVGRRRVHLVTYSPADGRVPARLERKRVKIDGTAVRRRSAISSVTPVTPRPGRCITVDSPDGLYLVGRHLTPTHNSWRVSRAFPLWLLHRNPDLRIGIVTYAEDLAVNVAGKVRNDLDSHPELDIHVSKSTRAKGEWAIEGYEGGVIARGIGGGLTGRPIDVLIIDDPLKDRKEADSETYRNRAWDWWTEVGSARLGPNAIVIVVMTRWHEDDLAGRLLAQDKVNAVPDDDPLKWRIINIPAKAEHDEAVPNEACQCGGAGAGCAEREILGRQLGEYMTSARGRTQAEWENRERTAGSYAWAALYQGHPSPADGGILKRKWFSFYEIPRGIQTSDGSWYAPGSDQVWASVDASFKDTSASDYVAIQVWGRRGPRAWLLDQIWDRMDFVRTCSEIEFIKAKWPQISGILIEDKANGPAVIASLSRKVPGIVAETPTESKESRVHSVAPFIEAGSVEFPHPNLAPWMIDFLAECTSFPNGAHDDQVDAMSQMLRRLFLAAGGTGDQFMAALIAEQQGGAPDGTQGQGGRTPFSGSH